MQNKIKRIIERNQNNIVEIISYFSEPGIEDWFIREKPQRLFTEEVDGLTDEGLILSFHFNNAMFTFTEKSYNYYADEFKNYISLGSKKHDEHYIIINFIKE